MLSVYVIQHYLPKEFVHKTIKLTTSKSESNRVLIIQALTKEKITIQHLSTAKDTVLMQKLLYSTSSILNVQNAGTVMRLLSAFFCVREYPKQLIGIERMHQRPIKILVDALRELGAVIEYLSKEGYPPIYIRGIDRQISNKIIINTEVSSQYISALLLIAPILPYGLTLYLKGKIVSKLFIDMTIGIMQHFGIDIIQNKNCISIASQHYHSGNYTVESDWTSASYWYSIVALSSHIGMTLLLLGLKKESLQGDQQIISLMKPLGVCTTFVKNGVILQKKHIVYKRKILLDFIDCPDLAPTVLVAFAALKKTCFIKGIQNLHIKETDRIMALQQELRKINASLQQITHNLWKLIPLAYDKSWIQSSITIATYGDHRMAMAFSPLAMLGRISIENPAIVAKSYPAFWKDMQKVGFIISKE